MGLSLSATLPRNVEVGNKFVVVSVDRLLSWIRVKFSPKMTRLGAHVQIEYVNKEQQCNAANVLKTDDFTGTDGSMRGLLGSPPH